MPISTKPYRCKECGHKIMQQTNHYGETYSLGSYSACPVCPPYKRPTTWIFDGVLPDGAWVPEPWRTVKLGDIATITKGQRR